MLIEERVTAMHSLLRVVFANKKLLRFSAASY